MIDMTIHKTVLLEETIETLNLKAGMTVVDATLGGGGHSALVAEKIGARGKLIAFDQDHAAIASFEKKIEAGKSREVQTEILLVHDNFANLKVNLDSLGIESVDGILADLGISSDQLADTDRGISFASEAPLDMRMDRRKELTAERLVNEYSQAQLTTILREFGGEQYAGSIARKIVLSREQAKIETVFQLVAIIESAVPAAYKHKKIHPATKTFQALRMEVNQELETLRSFLLQAVEVLKIGGRLAVITFHSGEDALVKHWMRENARGCICPPAFPQCRCGHKPALKIITRKALVASEDELKSNPRARSAKLRVVERV